MTWTAPFTAVTGMVMSAAQWNQQVRDNFIDLNAAHGASVYKTAAYNILTGTFTTFVFEAEDWDTDNYHDAVTTPSRITIPTGRDGKYDVKGQWAIGANATGARQLIIMKNGVAVTSGPIEAAQGSTTQILQTARAVQCVAGDYLELQCWQNSTVTLAGTVGSTYTWFSAVLQGA